MWALTITSPNTPRRFQVFADSEVRIGSRAEDNQLVLAGADTQHARMLVTRAKYIVVDLKSREGVLVNGKRITSPLVVGLVDEIEIAGHTLSILDLAPKRSELRPLTFDPDEECLLDDINAGDEHSRDVYADLLESRGELARAELVRIIDRRNDLRVLELMASTTLWWRMRIARSPIEGCTARDCPRTWSALRNQRDEVRRCVKCKREVHYCVDVAEALDQQRAGNRVALDPLSLRWNHDLRDDYRRR